MKKFVSIFLLIFFSKFTYCLGKREFVVANQFFLSFKSEKIFLNPIAFLKDKNSQDNSLPKCNKKRKRGLQPTLVHIADVFCFNIQFCEIELSCSAEIFYSQSLYFGLGERAPPLV